MFENLSSKLNKYYQFSFIFIIVTILCAVFYFWKLGFLDGSRSKDLHKASYTFETLSEQNLSQELEELVKAQNYKGAFNKIESFDKKAKYINSIVPHEYYQKSFKDLEQVKSKIAGLISTPRTSKVFRVFNEKLLKFITYVKLNKWRTLSRMSDRILALSTERSSKSLGKIVKKIKNDFFEMQEITKNSILKDEEKSEIISRISNLEVELGMLSQYLNKKKGVSQELGSFIESKRYWLSAIGPELSVQKLQIERMGRYYLMGMLGTLILTSLFYLGGILFYHNTKKRSQGKLEKAFEEIISEVIVKQNEKDIELLFSDKFRGFLKKTSLYINKRMSFGTIFQDALPFSSIMLDKNLKVDWANKQFSDDWKMAPDEITKDYMSWDYLNKLTNIGHNDPVLDALKNNIAGIYQIQIRPNRNSEVHPFEMFVSPVIYNGEKKIMLFFYPLSSIQETIKDQAKSIMNPIEKSLLHLKDGTFKNLDMEQLRSEYEIGSIDSMLDHFIDMESKISSEKIAREEEIESLTSEIEELNNIFDELTGINLQSFNNSKGQLSSLKSFKSQVITLLSTNKHAYKSIYDLFEAFSHNSKQLEQKRTSLTLISNSLNEMAQLVPNFNKTKDELKNVKSKTMDSKSKLSHDLGDLIHFKKKMAGPENIRRFQELYNKIAKDYNDLDESLILMTKKVMQLEVALSKNQMLFNSLLSENSGLKSSLEYKEEFSEIEETKERARQLIDQIEKDESNNNKLEEEVVETLKTIYHSFKMSLTYHSQISDSINKAEKKNQVVGLSEYDDCGEVRSKEESLNSENSIDSVNFAQKKNEVGRYLSRI